MWLGFYVNGLEVGQEEFENVLIWNLIKVDVEIDYLAVMSEIIVGEPATINGVVFDVRG